MYPHSFNISGFGPAWPNNMQGNIPLPMNDRNSTLRDPVIPPPFAPPGFGSEMLRLPMPDRGDYPYLLRGSAPNPVADPLHNISHENRAQQTNGGDASNSDEQVDDHANHSHQNNGHQEDPAENRNAPKQAVFFKVGDNVLIKANPMSSALDSVTRKFFFIYEGPYVITKVLRADVFMLQHPSNGKERGMFHISLLKPYHRPTGDQKSKGKTIPQTLSELGASVFAGEGPL